MQASQKSIREDTTPIKPPTRPQLLTWNARCICFLSGSICFSASNPLAVPLVLSDTDVEPAEKCVCKLVTAAHSDLRVQVGVLVLLDEHLFLRLMCPNLVNVDVDWTDHYSWSSVSLSASSRCLLGRHETSTPSRHADERSCVLTCTF